MHLAAHLKIDARFILNRNEFRDLPHILQLFAEEITTQFVNLESVELDKSEMSTDDDYFFKGKVVMSESKQI